MSTQKAVVITGASTGIGEACAVGLYDQGFIVYAGVRNDEAAVRLQVDRDDRMRPIHIDVTNDDEIKSAVESVSASLNGVPLWGLVNNAGITVAGPLEFMTTERMRWQLDVNVTGQVAVTSAFLPMIRKSKGRIVFIGSTSGFMASPLQGAYCASKHAIEAICDTLRLELKPWEIEVSCVQPGMIRTPIWEKSTKEANAFLENAPPELMELYGPLVNAVTDYAAKAPDMSAPVDVVVRDVIHALTASRPKTRYLNGAGARTQKIISRLPDRLREWVLHRFISM